MITSNLPSNMANLVAPFVSPGQKSVGLEDVANRNTPLKPVEQSAEGGRQQLSSRSARQDTYFPGLVDSDAESDTYSNPYASPNESAQTAGTDATASGNQEQRAESAREARIAEQEQREIKRLSARDREVRAHEQAHAAVGGQYAGAAQLQYERGPDGVRYAVAGEVPIDIGRESSPEATVRKAQIVRRAAMAPAEPSPQDRRVAAEATRIETQAKQEIAVQKARERTDVEESQPSEVVATADKTGESQNNATPRNTNPSVSPAEPVNSLVRPAGTFLSSRLIQGIANTSLNSPEPGSILDQLV